MGFKWNVSKFYLKKGMFRIADKIKKAIWRIQMAFLFTQLCKCPAAI